MTSEVSAFGFAPRQKMNELGIGYSGFRGVSWLCTKQPLVLPTSVKQQLERLGSALFRLTDSVADFAEDPQSTRRVAQLLRHKVPEAVARWNIPGRVEILRPDIVITPKNVAVATEVESCGAGWGISHALEVGYDLPATLLEAFLQYLAGRRLLVVATHRWVEYLWEILVFLRALSNRGIETKIVFDRPLDEVCARAQQWQMPEGTPPALAQYWNTGLMARLEQLGSVSLVGELSSVVAGGINERTVVFRFGYVDSFTPETLAGFTSWHGQGATFANPAKFWLDSKSLLATTSDDQLRQQLRVSSQTELDLGIAETFVLSSGFADLSRIVGQRNQWISKYAGFDGDETSWGARSLAVGTQHNQIEWVQEIDRRIGLPFPVVAQRLAPSQLFDVSIIDFDDSPQTMPRCRIRLTPFYLRGKGCSVTMAGVSATLRSAKTFRVHGSTDAAECPVVFQD